MDKKTYKVYYKGLSKIANADAQKIFKQAQRRFITEVFNIQLNNDILTAVYEFGFNEMEEQILKLKPVTPTDWASKFVDLCKTREDAGECLNILCNLHNFDLLNYQAKIVKVLNDLPDVQVKEVKLSSSDTSSSTQSQEQGHSTGQIQPNDKPATMSGVYDNHLVGDEPLDYDAVSDVVRNCATPGQVWDKLIDLARSLKIPSETLKSVNNRISNDTLKYPAALQEILEAWRDVSTDKATLANLISVLRKKGLNGSADALQKHQWNVDD